MRRHELLAALLVAGTVPAAADEVREVVHLTVNGGPNAGKYETSTEKGGCTYGLAGPTAWGNQISDPKQKDPKKLNSVQLIVPDTKKAAGGATEFLLIVRFGPLMGGNTSYTIDTRPPKKSGSGTVTVEDHGATALVKIAATRADGVKFDGTIDCKTVMRAR